MIKSIIFDFNRTLFDPERADFNPKALVVLKKLKSKYKLFLISSGGTKRQDLINRLNLKDYFLKITITEKEKSQEDFADCLTKGNCLPEETLVLGDVLNSEIFLGKGLGTKTVWFKKGLFSNQKITKKNKPDYIISSLWELLSLIDKIEKRELV